MLRLTYMDNKNPVQNQPVQDTMQPQSAPVQQPVSPVSGGNKEHAPIGAGSEHIQVSPVEASPVIPHEVREAGVEESPDTTKPDIPPDVQQLGLQPVKTAVAVPTQLSDQVVIPTPMNYQQAVTTLKEHKADESVAWLSMLSKYILEKLGMQNIS